MLDDKSKAQRSMMDALPTPATIPTPISAFQGPPQHMIPQHPNSGASALPPPNQSLSSVHPAGIDNMSSIGRSPSRTLTNSKRAAQNRAAQRAFRQRKDKYIKDLEAKAKDLDSTKKQLDNLLKERAEMAQTIKNLKAEIAKLKGEEVSEDEGRQVFGSNNLSGGNSGNSSNSNYSHYGNSTRSDEDPQGLGDEPWLRHKDLSRKDCNTNASFSSNEERSNNFPFSPSSSSSTSSSSSGLNRSNALADSSSRGGTGLVLPPGPNTDSSVDPYFRPDYRNAASHHTSPTSTSSPSSERNRNSSYPTNNNNNSVININHNGRYSNNNEEDTDRVYDDLCELLKTRTRPALPQNIGNLWQTPHSSSQQGVVSNGSGTVVG